MSSQSASKTVFSQHILLHDRKIKSFYPCDDKLFSLLVSPFGNNFLNHLVDSVRRRPGRLSREDFPGSIPSGSSSLAAVIRESHTSLLLLCWAPPARQRTRVPWFQRCSRVSPNGRQREDFIRRKDALGLWLKQ